MSEEKRIDRIERLAEQNTKGIEELRLMMVEDRSMMNTTRSNMEETLSKIQSEHTQTLSKILSDNAVTRETLHRENARTAWRMITGSAVGGAIAALIAVYLGSGQ